MHDNITYSELNCIRVTVSGPLTWRHRQQSTAMSQLTTSSQCSLVEH